MAVHRGMMFSTRDQDNDEAPGASCAHTFKGAWWYSACHACNLNGQYLNGVVESHADGVIWYDWKGLYYSLKSVEMKVRPGRYCYNVYSEKCQSVCYCRHAISTMFLIMS